MISNSDENKKKGRLVPGTPKETGPDDNVSAKQVHSVVTELLGGRSHPIISTPMMNNHDSADPTRNLLLDQSSPVASPKAIAASVASNSSAERNFLLQTMNSRIADTQAHPAVKRYYGSASSQTVPSVLTRGCFFRSWSDALPLVFNDYYPGAGASAPNPPPTGASAPYSTPSPLTLNPEATFDSKPTLADSTAYAKAISGVLSGLYSQSVRLDCMAGVRPFMALQLAPGYLSSPYANVDVFDLSDSCMIDPVGDAVYANTMSSSFSSGDARLIFINGGVEPWEISTSNGSQAISLPVSSTFGFANSTFADSMLLTEQAAAQLEFYRQMLCSPVLFFRASARTGVSPSKVPFYSDRGVTADVASVLSPQAIDPLGTGGISVSIRLTLQDIESGESLTYPELSMAVSFSITSVGHAPELLVPRGKNIAGVFHPGFDLGTRVLTPIVPQPDKEFSWSFDINAVTWGSASAYAWTMSMANPASADLRSLL